MRRPEKLLYQANKQSYRLALLMIAINALYAVEALNTMSINMWIGVTTMFNIILSLFAFLAAVKVKIYSIYYSVIILCLGLFQYLRLLFLPSVPESVATRLILYLCVSGLFGIFSGITAIRKVKIRQGFIKKNQIDQTHFSK